MLADLYDFDKTVFDGESGEFWLFCLKRHPSIIRFLPKQAAGLFGHYVFRKISKKHSKELFYSYLKAIDAEKEAELFWQEKADRMNDWFNPREHDVKTVVCSASPVFQIKPICDRLGVDLLIATRMNTSTGLIEGENCKSTEKVSRLKKLPITNSVTFIRIISFPTDRFWSLRQERKSMFRAESVLKFRHFLTKI